MNDQPSSVFDSFNARSLAPEQVARSFIAPPSFASLALRCHSTVIGPRGSGKTSVLKMLQPSALEAWTSQEALSYRSQIDYTGVFIPTDISWSRQTSALVSGLSPNLQRLFRTAAFCTQVLHELLDVMCWRLEPAPSDIAVPFRRAGMDRLQEAATARQLAKVWHLNPATDTLIGVKHSLSARLIEIWQIAQRACLLDSDAGNLPAWLSLDFMSCCCHAVELYDDAISDRQSRWALLFDELELAPDWLLEGLVAALRSTASKFILKLAISPFNDGLVPLQAALQASPDQDFNEIRLWYPRKEDGFEFSEKLFLSICRDRGLHAKSASEVLGRSLLDAEASSARSYSVGGRNYRALARALRNDPGFAKYWKEQKLSLDTIADMDETDRAARVRKIYPLVVVRSFFRAPALSKQSVKQMRRGRKTMELYTGAGSIFSIAEANPRWIIGLTRLLLPEKSNGAVRRSFQARQIESTIHKFRARLKTISVDATSVKYRARSLLEFLDTIGAYFERVVILDDFQSQPHLSFVVDLHASSQVVSIVSRAVNSGAIVYVPEADGSSNLSDLRGKRFRLSYLLAPFYHLPLRLGATVSLLKIFRAPVPDESKQGDLLFD